MRGAVGRDGCDEAGRRAANPLLHGRRGVDGEQVVQQGCLKTLAKLGQRYGQHTRRLGAVPLDHHEAPGVQDGTVRA
jgi:hypothetical protein